MKPLLSVSSLSFSYGDQSVLEDTSFTIYENDFLAIIGPNGSGKTTLLKILLGFLQPDTGKIQHHVKGMKIGYVPQRYTIDKNFPGTVKEILSSASHKIMHQVEIEDLLSKKFVDLSGGQQQRVLIALALQQNPKILILDEPTAGVDVDAQQRFYTLLKSLNKSGMAIIIVTHEVGVIPSLVKRVACINHKVCCAGELKEMPKLLKQMYGPHFVHHHHGLHDHAEHHGHHHGAP